ncbi:hypothetical protein L7F22_046045 [Adiantum nelumboides]|nr:hypothetical protein [Adiantum nelumboides]
MPSAFSSHGDLHTQPASSPSQILDIFESRVRRAKRGALLVAGLHSFTRFLGICSLFWATIVLLGGLASSLRTLDFFLITALVLLEGAGLFTTQTFSKVFSETLFRESHRPQDFQFRDTQYDQANRLDSFGQSISFIFATASLIITNTRVALSGDDTTKNRNVVYALYLFYMLVTVNSSLSMFSAFLRPSLRRKCDGWTSDSGRIKQSSLMNFHDEVYKMAMDVGFSEAHQLEILEVAFTKLANDYKRNIRPPLIKAQNKDLICYLYHNQQGIALSCEYLKGADVWKKLVAANLPGFWAGEPRIELQVVLFWALRKRMYGAGKDSESALNSIECLGHAWSDMPKFKPYPFLINDPASATNIVDTLVHLLLEPIRPTLLFQLRAFEACCQNTQVLQHIYKGRTPQEAQGLCKKLQVMIVGGQHEIDETVLPELCCKLFKYLSEKGIWMATKIYAGSALLSLLCYGSEELGEEAMKALQGPVEEFIDPAKASGNEGKRPYFWFNDMLVVETMRKKLQLPRYERWSGVWIRSPDGVELSLERALALLKGL